MNCGNGSVRAQHPVELSGDDWFEDMKEREAESAANREREVTA